MTSEQTAPADPDESDSIRTALRTALTAAMKRRDRAAVQTYRVALAAVDNAEAVPLTARDRAGAIESSAGSGVTEVARRTLDHDQMVGIVRAEAADRRETARLLRAASPGRADALERADALDREAGRLEELLPRR